MATPRSLRDRIYRSPAIKTAISVSLSILIGLFTNSLTAEISTSRGLDWARVPITFSFWALLVSAFLLFLFHRYMHEHESDIAAFKDADFCVAYARSQLIPAQMDAAKQAIADGDTERFKLAMKQVKDALK